MNIPTFTLLIVEDFAPDRELYRRALSQDSSCVYQLLEAESVETGLALCRVSTGEAAPTSIIDAILLDYALPDGDGLAFLAALDAQSNGSSPPVVMVTGVGNQGVAVRAMKLGAEDYLVKGDLTPQLLQSTMRSAVENAHLRRQLQQSEQAEHMLQANNQQITTIWESMTDAYITLDLEWRMIYANPAAAEIVRQLVGLTPEEFLGKTHWEVFPWSVGNIVEQEYRRAVTDRVAVHFEMLYEPTITWFEVHAYPSEIGLGVYFRDINERKQQEAARIQAERERDRFFELSLDLLAIANLDSYFLRLNPAWEQTLGFTTAELMAQSYLDFVHPDDRAATLATAQGLSRGQTVIRFENRYRCKDGSYRWLSWSSRPYDEQNLVYAVAYDITTQKRDEELLRQSEEFKRRILESNRDCIKVLDSAGRLIYMNDYGQSLMEIDDFSTVANSQWLELWQGSERELALTAFNTALAGGVNRFDGYCATTKGTPKWWEVIVTPILATDGRVSQILSVSRDITERKQMEAERLAAEQERDRFFDLSLDLLAIGNFEGYFVRINPAFERLLGFTAAEFMAQPFIDFVHPDDRESTQARAQSLAQDAIVVDFENRCRCKDGSYVWVSWNATPYQQSNCWYGVGRDITERKRAERDLRESQERLQAGIEVAGVGLARFDYETNLVALSPEAAVLYGFPADIAFVTREQIHDTFHPDERADLEVTIAQVVDPNGAGWFAQDHRVVWPSGEVRCLSVRKQVVFVGVGDSLPLGTASPGENRVGAVPHPSYAILAAIDITLRKQAQADLEQRNQDLASFAYVVSHDLKAPLRAVANLSQWIEEDFDGLLSVANQQQMILLRSRVYQMEATIDGLLDYARVGISVETIESVSIAELLADVIDSIAPPPTFTIELPPELPILSTRRLPLFQVFANLIGNGIKHHDAEDGSIQISIEDRGDCYEFAIADDGPGIAPEHHDRMFKIFQAVNPQNRSDSTGIGLAIVKKIVEAEGGTIWLESEIGQGTTFYFTWLQR
jgi:PAS domain S-box-containing protein